MLKRFGDYRNWDEATALGLLLGLSISLRILLMVLLQRPVLCDDSAGYLRLAEMLRSLEFAGFLGDRTPVYPALLALLGRHLWLVWIVQSAMGVLISLLLFKMARLHRMSVPLAFLVGLSHTLCLNQLIFESAILTETLTTCLVVLFSFLCLKIALDKVTLKLVLALGCVISLATLTRPSMVFLIPLSALFLLLVQMRRPRSFTTSVLHLTTLAMPVFLLVGSWAVFVRSHTGQFSITTMMGFHLTNHTGAWMEKAPAEFKDVQQVYLRHRDELRLKTGTHVNTIWRALPDLLQETGLSFGHLSERMTRLSLALIKAEPMQYVKSVARSWLLSWQSVAIGRRDAEKVHRHVFYSLLLLVPQAIETGVLLLVNAAFLLLIGQQLCVALIQRRAFPISLLVLAAVPIGGTLFQALFEIGDNARFFLPFQPIVLLLVLSHFRISSHTSCEIENKMISSK